MSYDPDRHHRRSIRLQGYDYAQMGAYYVTICTYERTLLFGEVAEGIARLNLCGQTVERCWRQLAQHFPAVSLDAFVLMPNHLHGIIVIGAHEGEEAAKPFSTPDMRSSATKDKGEEAAKPVSTSDMRSSAASSPLPERGRPHGTQPGSLAAIVQTFKAESTRRLNRILDARGNRIWQRNYYERIIRDEDELQRIRQYIADNPAQWTVDHDNPTTWRFPAGPANR